MCRRDVFRHMFIPKEHPLHLVQVNAVSTLQNATYPYTWGQGIAAHPNSASVQVQRRLHARLDVVDYPAMFEAAQQEDWQSGHGLVIRPRAEIGREGHLRDVELQATHHPSKGACNRRNI